MVDKLKKKLRELVMRFWKLYFYYFNIFKKLTGSRISIISSTFEVFVSC